MSVRLMSPSIIFLVLFSLSFIDPKSASATQVVAGGNHSCLLRADRTVVCWGNNEHGQLGDGTTTRRPLPTRVVGLSDVSLITAGYAHTCALLMDGTLRCWGDNRFGQLGDGTVWDKHVPTPIATLNSVSMVSAGFHHTCARNSTGGSNHLFCWGENLHGEIGNGETAAAVVLPTFVEGLGGIHAMSAGSSHTCVVVDDETVRCWGLNSNGQLGDGTTVDRSTPTAVVGLTGVLSVSAGGLHTCAATQSKDVYCWGFNNHGQLGIGTLTQAPVPQWVDLPADAVAVHVGHLHTCAVLQGGVFLDTYAMCWGDGEDGRLGDGEFQDASVPQVVPSLRPLTMSVGFAHACAKVDHALGIECWGSGIEGQLGTGALSDHAEPVAVDFDTIFSADFGTP